MKTEKGYSKLATVRESNSLPERSYVEPDGILYRRNRKRLLKANEPYNASEGQSELNESDKSAEVE